MLATDGHPSIASRPVRDRLSAHPSPSACRWCRSALALRMTAGSSWRSAASSGSASGPSSPIAKPTRPAAASAERIFGAALVLAAKAVILGDLLASVALGVLGSTSGSGEAVLAIPLLAVVGLVIFGLPAFVLAFLVFWPWGLPRPMAAHDVRAGRRMSSGSPSCSSSGHSSWSRCCCASCRPSRPPAADRAIRTASRVSLPAGGPADVELRSSPGRSRPRWRSPGSASGS